jgi:8-oxo-dGTP diphosphatase
MSKATPFVHHNDAMERWEEYLFSREKRSPKSLLSATRALLSEIQAWKSLIADGNEDVEPTRGIFIQSSKAIAKRIVKDLESIQLTDDPSIFDEVDALQKANAELEEKLLLIQRRYSSDGMTLEDLKKADELIPLLDDRIDAGDVEGANKILTELREIAPNDHPEIIRADVILPMLMESERIQAKEAENTSSNTVVGVGVVIVNGSNKVLLGLRKGSHRAGTWGFPGGHLDFGEMVSDCSVRETLEETGLNVVVVDSQFDWNERISSDKGHYITMYTRAELAGDDTPILMEPDKCETWQWFSLEEVENLTLMEGDKMKQVIKKALWTFD